MDENIKDERIIDVLEARYLENMKLREGDIRFLKQEIYNFDREAAKERKWARESRDAQLRGAKDPLFSDWDSSVKAAYERADELEEKKIKAQSQLNERRAQLREVQMLLKTEYGYNFDNYTEPDTFPSIAEQAADFKAFLKRAKESFKPEILKKALIITFAYAAADLAGLGISYALYLANLAGLLITVVGPVIYAVIVSKKLFSVNESRKGGKRFIAYGLGLAITISTMYEFSPGLVIRTAIFCIIASLILERMTGAK